MYIFCGENKENLEGIVGNIILPNDDDNDDKYIEK